jgi:DNA-binding transcriptional regulator YdaS (Cro superfamily)
MTTQEAVSHYGSQQKLATALGIKQPTVSGWGVYPPAIRQIQLERLTRGRLKAEPGLLSVKRAA